MSVGETIIFGGEVTGIMMIISMKENKKKCVIV